MNVEYLARVTCSCGTVLEVEAFAAYNTFGYDGCEAYIDHAFLPEGWLGGFDEKHKYKCPKCLGAWRDSGSTDIEDLYR